MGVKTQKKEVLLKAPDNVCGGRYGISRRVRITPLQVVSIFSNKKDEIIIGKIVDNMACGLRHAVSPYERPINALLP